MRRGVHSYLARIPRGRLRGDVRPVNRTSLRGVKVDGGDGPRRALRTARRRAKCRIFLSPSTRLRKGRLTLPTSPNWICRAVAPRTKRHAKTSETPFAAFSKPARIWGRYRKFSRRPATSVRARHGERRSLYHSID